MLERVGPAFEYEEVPVLRKDSLELTAEDRQRIRDACRASGAERIVVTHGTDSMIESALVLATLTGKVIVLTGAMRPERFSDSDTTFNLGVAVGAVQTLRPGVYLAMHGRVYPWDAVRRNAAGQFVGRDDRDHASGPNPSGESR